MSSLFPISEYWSWSTFFLYTSVGLVVSYLCYKGKCVLNNNSTPSIRYIQVGNIYFFLAWLILVCLASFRSTSVGPDTQYYVSDFLNKTTVSFDWKTLFSFHQIEFGYQYYVYFIRSFTQNYHVFFFITYGFVAFSYLKFIHYFFDKNDGFLFLPIIIFFYVNNMSGVRGAIAVSFVILSFIMLDKDRYLGAMVLTLIAFSFHYTMIYNFYIIIVVALFKRKVFENKRFLWILALLASVGVASIGLTFLKGLFTGTKYNHYASVDANELSFLGSIIYVIYGIICVVYYKQLIINNKTKTSLFISLAFLITYPVIYITAAYRIPNYYALPRLMIWSVCIDLFRNRHISNSSKIVYDILIGLIVCLYLLFRFTRFAASGCFEYSVF